jgi:hypothetical protein
VPPRPHAYVSHVLDALRTESPGGHVVAAPGRGPVDGLVVGPNWTIAVVACRPPIRPDELVRGLRGATTPEHDGVLFVLDAAPASPIVGRVAQQVGTVDMPRAIACWRPGSDRTTLVAGLRGIIAVLDARNQIEGDESA